MILLLGTKEMDKESDIGQNKERGRIRSVENPLEPLHTGTVNTVVNRRSSAKTPVRKIRRKSEIEKNSFMKYKTNEESSKKCRTCGNEEYPQILGNRSGKKIASMSCHEESDEELEIVAPSVHE